MQETETLEVGWQISLQDIPAQINGCCVLTCLGERTKGSCGADKIELFARTEHLHRLDARDLALIETAAHLHDIGRALSLTGHHRHSAYLVEHADVRGLSPDDLAMVLALVRSHRGGPPKISYPPFRAMGPDQRGRARVMAALLLLADALDRPRDGSVQRIEVDDAEGTLRIRTIGTNVAPDRAGMQDRVEYAESIFRRKIEFTS